MSRLPKAFIPPERIEKSILMIRGHRMMLDSDLAGLYGVETKELNRAVRRNLDRFPIDFMFQLNRREFDNLRFQFGASRSWGGRRYLPHAFTQEGVAMLSSVLRSKRAVAVNIEIMRAFVHLRRILASHAQLARRLIALEKKYDGQFAVVFDAIRSLMAQPDEDSEKPKIGYESEAAR